MTITGPIARPRNLWAYILTSCAMAPVKNIYLHLENAMEPHTDLWETKWETDVHDSTPEPFFLMLHCQCIGEGLTLKRLVDINNEKLVKF